MNIQNYLSYFLHLLNNVTHYIHLASGKSHRNVTKQRLVNCIYVLSMSPVHPVSTHIHHFVVLITLIFDLTDDLILTLQSSRDNNHLVSPRSRGAAMPGFGYIVGQIIPKWDKSEGLFQTRLQYILGRRIDIISGQFYPLCSQT